MAKIDPLTGSLIASQKIIPKKNKKARPKGNFFFSDILANKDSEINGSTDINVNEAHEITRDELSQLIDDMHDLGKKMSSTQSMKDLLEYKKTVKQFLIFFVRNSIKNKQVTSKNLSVANRGGFKQYTLLEIIDSKLENLAAAVLSNHHSNLELLKKVDEIQGLMIDLIA